MCMLFKRQCIELCELWGILIKKQKDDACTYLGQLGLKLFLSKLDKETFPTKVSGGSTYQT